MTQVFGRSPSLKDVQTHFCPGCHHGSIHRLVADALDELAIREQTIGCASVGCSVFLYSYFNIDVVESPHGRAPAVATGVKRARPDRIVFTYQGDGDLAAIGMSEIIHAANRGEDITVIFVNNTTYGMTGGQMAPTTLIGQRTTTTPDGRPVAAGQPLKMAELIAGLDGPVYVERVALYDNKRRTRAKRAIRNALECQVNGTGFAFVEVLSECPLHLGLDPADAEDWVRDNMEPIFGLGIKKDITKEAAFPEFPEVGYDPEPLLDAVHATTEQAPRFAGGRFPAHLDPCDVSLKLAGAGGDGAQTAALLITRCAINEGFDSTHIPSYGPESRGGTSYADVHVTVDEVLSPASPTPHVLVAFNAPSLAKFGPTVRSGGTILYDSSVIHELPDDLAPDVRTVGVPLTEVARGELGNVLVKNVVALGALQEATAIFPADTFLTAIREALASKPTLIPLNEEAFAWGGKLVRELP